MNDDWYEDWKRRGLAEHADLQRRRRREDRISALKLGALWVLFALGVAMAIGGGLACDAMKPREYHIACPRCESAQERAALVDCLAKFRPPVMPEDDEFGTTVANVNDACKEAVCPRRPTVCTGYAICGQSYCLPEDATRR